MSVVAEQNHETGVARANHEPGHAVKEPERASLPSGLIKAASGADERMVGWSWRYESADGEPVAPADVPPVETFPTQSDAESWLGEEWRPLLAAGVARVSLLEGERVVYGPMSLDPAS